MSHTKGDCKVQTGRCNGDYLVTSENGIVQPEENEANRCLIEASPKLLKALEQILEQIRDKKTCICSELDEYEKPCDFCIANNAIEKAKERKL